MSRKQIQILMVRRKEFWAFVGGRTKRKRKKNIPSLKSEAGVSVTSTRGKYYKGTISNWVSLVWIVILMPSGSKRLRVIWQHVRVV